MVMPSRFCIHYVSMSGRPSSGHRTGKGQSHPNSQEEFTKEWVNHWIITLISHSSKVMLKILQARLQHYMNQELPDVQAGIRKGRGTRDQIANIFWIIQKAREFQKKNIYYCCFIDYTKALTVWILTNCRKLLQRWEYQRVLPVSWENCMKDKNQQLKPCMEQLIGSSSRKEYKRDVWGHPVCSTYKLSISWKMPDWISYKLESR